MTSHGKYRYRLSVQTVLPPDYENNETFRRTAEGLRGLGLWGVELNVGDLEDPRSRDLAAIREFLSRFDLEFSMFASGLTAKTLGISLSSIDEGERRRAVEGARKMIDWVARGGELVPERADAPIGIIVGFLKGGIQADRGGAQSSLIESLRELAPDAERGGVPLIIEATNRYESSVINSVADGVEVITQAGGAQGTGILQILPDTFHMNIEEANMAEAIADGSGHFTSFHLSDNNRKFPGFGAIDFGAVIAQLDRIGYEGRIAIEGNLEKDLVSDLEKSVRYLSPMIEA